MDNSHTSHPHRASFKSRLATVVAIGLVFGLLGMARSLTPDPKGYGTHQQLGFPPCSSILLWGSKCPACGMTTAWSYATRGRVIDAWHANSGGAVLVFVAVVYGPLFGYYAWRGRWTGGWLSLSLATGLTAALLLSVIQRFT